MITIQQAIDILEHKGNDLTREDVREIQKVLEELRDKDNPTKQPES